MKLLDFLPASVVLFVVLALPRVAFACPSCAGSEEGGTSRIILLGLMILIPFCIVAGVFRVLRTASSTTAPGPLPDVPVGHDEPSSKTSETGTTDEGAKG